MKKNISPGNPLLFSLIPAFVALLFPAPSADAAGSAEPAGVAGSAEKGRAIAEKYCSRCHVIGAHNPMGGIGSTASFQMISKMRDYLERFQTFYARRPHPAFLRVPGVPKWSNQPGYATEITVTLDQVDDIVALVKTLEKMPIRRKKPRPQNQRR
jgi:mono/diheme cytochrome c family protein